MLRGAFVCRAPLRHLARQMETLFVWSFEVSQGPLYVSPEQARVLGPEHGPVRTCGLLHSWNCVKAYVPTDNPFFLFFFWSFGWAYCVSQMLSAASGSHDVKRWLLIVFDKCPRRRGISPWASSESDWVETTPEWCVLRKDWPVYMTTILWGRGFEEGSMPFVPCHGCQATVYTVTVGCWFSGLRTDGNWAS